MKQHYIIFFVIFIMTYQVLQANDKNQAISYAQWMADSEIQRFPQAYQLDHGKRLFFGYAQGVGCCAMLKMWNGQIL